jgi:hypothetical protein
LSTGSTAGNNCGVGQLSWFGQSLTGESRLNGFPGSMGLAKSRTSRRQR